MTRQMHLGVFTYPGGHHIAGWRHGSVVPGDILGYDYYRRTAEAAERGKFDLVFVGDMLAAREKDGRVIASLPLGTEGVLDARLPQPAAPTVYARTGDSIAGIVIGMALVWVFVARWRHRQS